MFNLLGTPIANWVPQLGTCAMKPVEMGGVVDARLNVYGVKRLKVADLSIPPSNVNAVGSALKLFVTIFMIALRTLTQPRWLLGRKGHLSLPRNSKKDVSSVT